MATKKNSSSKVPHNLIDSLFFNEKTGYSEMKGSVKFSQGNTVLSSNYAQISFNLTTNQLEELYASHHSTDILIIGISTDPTKTKTERNLSAFS